MHNVLIIFYIAFSIGNLFILPELSARPGLFVSEGNYSSPWGKYFMYCTRW